MDIQNNILNDSQKIPFSNLKNVVSGVLSEQGRENTPENLEKVLNGETDFLKARIFDAMGWREYAEKYYLKSFNPDYHQNTVLLEKLLEQTKAKLNLGILYAESGKSDLAIELLQSVSDSAFLWIQNKAFFCLGDLYAKQGKKNKARKAYKEATKTGNPQIKNLAEQRFGNLV